MDSYALELIVGKLDHPGYCFLQPSPARSVWESHSDTFLVDSGSGDAVDHPVVKTMEAKQETTSGVGLGTPVTGYLSRLSGFKLGAFSFANVPVTCCGGTEQTSRLIGGEILHRFTLTFDYPPPTHILRAEPVLQF